MNFRIGQRVRAIALLDGSPPSATKFIGAIGTIVSEGQMQWYSCGNGDLWSYQVRWDKYGLLGFEPAKCLAPLDDDADFERFMDVVLKPLDQPVPA